MWWVMAAGLVMEAYGKYQANKDQAEAEAQNAAFYREQAAFAQKTAERQRAIFDRESVVLRGSQISAFAKAGVDSMHSARFLADQMIFRGQESQSIYDEGAMNVRLADLRSGQADATAAQLRDPTTNFMQAAGSGLQLAGSSGAFSSKATTKGEARGPHQPWNEEAYNRKKSVV
jgi:hypothetical protein